MDKSKTERERLRLLEELKRAQDFKASKQWELNVAQSKLVSIVRAINRLDGRHQPELSPFELPSVHG